MYINLKKINSRENEEKFNQYFEIYIEIFFEPLY